MTTKTIKNPPYVDQIIRYRTGAKVVRELAAQGVVVKVKDGRLKIWNATIDDDGRFLPVPAEAFERVAEHRDTVLEYLRRWERSVEKVAQVWWANDPEYREDCRRYWASQSDAEGNP